MKVTQILTFAVGPAGNALLGLATVPLIAWLFEPEDVGRMSMLNVALLFTVMLCSLGLDQAYVRDYHSETQRGQLLKNALQPGLMILLVLCTGFTLSPGSLSQLLLGQKSELLSLIIMIALISAFLSRFLSLILRMQGRGLAYSMGQLLPRVIMLSLTGIGCALFTRHQLILLVVAWGTGMAAAAVVLLWLTTADWKLALSSPGCRTRLREMMTFGLPLIPGGLAFWAASSVDRIFVRVWSGFEELAMFSVAISFAGIASLLQTVFSTVWTPYIYKIADTPKAVEEIVTRLSRWMTIAVVCLFSLAGLLSWVVRYLLPADYAGVEHILVACLGLPLLLTLSEVLSVGIGIGRKTLYMMVASGITLAVNITLNFLLVPGSGAGGAAAATCLSFWIFMVIRTEFSVWVWKRIPRFEAYAFTLLCACAASMSSLTGEKTRVSLIVIWCMLMVGVLLRHHRFIMEELSFLWKKKHEQGIQ